MSKNTFNQINLRLKMLYDMIPESARMGDVGTDHGYLPIYCIQTGKCGSAVASDLREGPLQTARNNIAAYGLEDRIETLLCSGLDGYRDRACDVIVIAGMGGFTIRKILADWLASRENGKDFPGNPLFLLQPNTAEPELRQFLWEHSFSIEEERAVKDGLHVYVGILGRFTGEPQPYTETECYTGKIMCGRLKESDRIYYEALYRKYSNVLAGLAQKRQLDRAYTEKTDAYERLLKELDRIIKSGGSDCEGKRYY